MASVRLLSSAASRKSGRLLLSLGNAAAQLPAHVPGPPLLTPHGSHASPSNEHPAQPLVHVTIPGPPRQPRPTCHIPTLCSAKLKLDRLRRRGKAPPKKGAGKRAGKKK